MEEKKTSGLGIASLILGIIGMLLSCIAIGIVPCIIGLILAIIGIANKNRKHGTCIAGLVCSVIGIGIFLIMIFFFNNIGNNEEKNIEHTNNSEIITNNTKEKSDFSESDFETNEYIYENTIGDTLYFVSIKNNSNTNISVSGNATAYDDSNNAIGADSAEIYALGSGEEQLLYFYFDSVTDVKNVEYTLNYEKDNIFTSALPYLQIEETVNDKNIVVKITNNGEKAADFVEVYVLFFDENGNLINYSSTYVVDNDSQIKSGATISEQITSYYDFDSVKTFYSGRN